MHAVVMQSAHMSGLSDTFCAGEHSLSREPSRVEGFARRIALQAQPGIVRARLWIMHCEEATRLEYEVFPNAILEIDCVHRQADQLRGVRIFVRAIRRVLAGFLVGPLRMNVKMQTKLIIWSAAGTV